jgi:hypothetical protein
MKKILSVAFVIFLTFNLCAQKTPNWIAEKATNMSIDMQIAMSLNDVQTTKVYDEEVNKMLALEKFKKENKGKKLSNKEFKTIITPFTIVQTEVVGGKKRMNQYWAYMKEKRAKEKASN